MAQVDTKYTLLGQHDVDEGEPLYLDSDTPISPTRVHVEERTHAELRWQSKTIAVLSFLSMLFLVLWIISTSLRNCTYIPRYSPANDAIEYIEHFKYIGAFLSTTPWRNDEYQGNPGSDIDSAWRRISTDVKPFGVTEEQLYKMGMSVTPNTVRVSEDEGGGYLASLEVTHHLHCLDMLRKLAYREYYESFDHAFQIEDEILMNQLETCIELLRQALMCYPDLNMLAYYWVRGKDMPTSDFSTVHRCKNFDHILDWAAGRAIHNPGSEGWKNALKG